MRLIIIASFMLVAASASAQTEQIAVTTPITFTAPPTINAYQPLFLSIQPVSVLAAHPTIRVQIVPTGGTAVQALTFDYPCPTGTCSNDNDAAVTTLITALNTANLTTRSLWRRVFDRLCLDFPSKFPNGCTVS